MTIRITDISTSCDNLVMINPCVDSFVALYTRTGDRITVTAEAKQGATDISGQINWICEDAPTDSFNSGTCNPATGSGATFNFIPNPPDAPTGRGWPLSYRVKATIGTTYEDERIITQDELDRLRQEYHDMGKNRKPERAEFVNAQSYINPGNFSFGEINDGDYGWALFTIAQNLQNVRAAINNQAMPVNSGYRNPIHNANINPPGATNSRHIYGDAADISPLGDYNGDGIAGNRPDWDMLAAAARNRGACVEPYTDTGTWVHMDWRQSAGISCPW